MGVYTLNFMIVIVIALVG